MNKLHVIALIVEDKPGVMSRVADVFRRRLINIDTITVGKTRINGLSRIVITLRSEDQLVNQVVKHLRNMIDVVEAEELEVDESVLRELALIKVEAEDSQSRLELLQLVNIFRAQVVDVSNSTLTIQIVGGSQKINAFLKLAQRFKVLEIARTGIVALTRGSKTLLPESREGEHGRS